MSKPLTRDPGAYSIPIIIIRCLSELLPNAVYADKLPPADSWLTNQDYAMVVSEVSDSDVDYTCTGAFAESLLQVTVYERIDCDEHTPGILELLVRATVEHLKQLEQTRSGDVVINTINKQSSVTLPYTGDDIRAIALTLSITLTYG